MRHGALFFALVALSGGAAANIDAAKPVAVVHSVHSRSEVADCLLSRLGGNGMRPEQSVSTDETTLRFTSLDQWTSPGLYLFTIKDEGAASLVEARIPHGFVKRGLPTAQTCF